MIAPVHSLVSQIRLRDLFQLESIGPGSFDGFDCACQTFISERGNPRGAMSFIFLLLSIAFLYQTETGTCIAIMVKLELAKIDPKKSVCTWKA